MSRVPKKKDVEYFREAVEHCREAIEDGDYENLLRAVLWATYAYRKPNPYAPGGFYGFYCPGFLETALQDAVMRGIRGEVRSWDEVFGKPVKKGVHIKGKMLRRVLTAPIIQRVEELSLQKVPKPELFKQVGQEMKNIAGSAVSGKLVQKIYYDPTNKNLRQGVRERLLRNSKTS
jgi:hypothetical protein